MENSENQKTMFPRGDSAPAEYFLGNVWIRTLVPADEKLNTVIANVEFAAGARNNWHTHPGGQILIATDGTGYYQEKGKPIQLLHKGDVVKIHPNVLHWHGASRDAAFTHIAINPNSQNGTVEWMERVTNEEYNSYQ